MARRATWAPSQAVQVMYAASVTMVNTSLVHQVLMSHIHLHSNAPQCKQATHMPVSVGLNQTHASMQLTTALISLSTPSADMSGQMKN